MKARSHHILEGNIKDYNPNFFPHIKQLIKQRNLLKQNAQPTTGDTKITNTLNATITEQINTQQRKKTGKTT